MDQLRYLLTRLAGTNVVEEKKYTPELIRSAITVQIKMELKNKIDRDFMGLYNLLCREKAHHKDLVIDLKRKNMIYYFNKYTLHFEHGEIGHAISILYFYVSDVIRKLRSCAVTDNDDDCRFERIFSDWFMKLRKHREDIGRKTKAHNKVIEGKLLNIKAEIARNYNSFVLMIDKWWELPNIDNVLFWILYASNIWGRSDGFQNRNPEIYRLWRHFEYACEGIKFHLPQLFINPLPLSDRFVDVKNRTDSKSKFIEFALDRCGELKTLVEERGINPDYVRGDHSGIQNVLVDYLGDEYGHVEIDDIRKLALFMRS